MTTQKTTKLLNYFIEQCKNPKGWIGHVMISIWNQSFYNMALWGLTQIELKESDVLLEVGCGGGKLLHHLAKKEQNKLYGIDCSKASITKASTRNQKYIENGKMFIEQTAIENSRFAHNMFDKILAVQTHIYWNNWEACLEIVYTILKHNGSFHIICEKDKIHYHLSRYENQQNMLQCLYTIGFKQVQIFETNQWIHYACQK